MLKNKNIYFNLLTVVIAMLSITQLFGSPKKNNDIPYMSRQINLSGNFVSFLIPENFSTDFPADDLIETVNLKGRDDSQEAKPITLLRRWWDFKDNSFFSKNVGSMMMTIHVYKVKDSQKDISNPIGFIEAIQLDLEMRDKEENSNTSEDFKVIYPSSYDSYVQKKFDRLTWLRNATGTFDERQVTYHYWVQIDDSHYLTVEFSFAPNDNIAMRTFIDTYCRDMLEKIMSTFDVIYSNENPIKAKLENNAQLNLEQLVKELN